MGVCSWGRGKHCDKVWKVWGGKVWPKAHSGPKLMAKYVCADGYLFTSEPGGPAQTQKPVVHTRLTRSSVGSNYANVNQRSVDRILKPKSYNRIKQNSTKCLVNILKLFWFFLNILVIAYFEFIIWAVEHEISLSLIIYDIFYSINQQCCISEQTQNFVQYIF